VSERVAIVTGASSGIGAATARQLLLEGWRVTGWDLVPSPVEGVRSQHVDVADPASVRAAAADVPSLDLLVNAAGISERAPAAEMTVDQWRRVLDVDLSGSFWCAQALHPALREAHGVVVSIASIAAHRSFAGRVNYCVAKAGIVAMTEVLGQEWAKDGIRVLAISPGYVATEMVKAAIAGGWVSEAAVRSRTPMDRLAEPEEIARSIVALASPAFSYATGTTVVVDGGWLAQGGFSSR
jgi:NAD(P)-dependent dehydrogenase (short-subunit alcohol dehydrogenase family)